MDALGNNAVFTDAEDGGYESEVGLPASDSALRSKGEAAVRPHSVSSNESNSSIFMLDLSLLR